MIPGDTPADRVEYVLTRATRGLQRDPQLTEALTRAFMFADSTSPARSTSSASSSPRCSTAPSRATSTSRAQEPTDDEIAVARVISDVWLAALVSWVTGRLSAEEVSEHLSTAVRLILR